MPSTANKHSRKGITGSVITPNIDVAGLGRSRGYIITGTGTGVGKTVVTGYLFAALVNRDGALGNLALKPLQTGLPAIGKLLSLERCAVGYNPNDDLGLVYSIANCYSDVTHSLAQARKMQISFSDPCSPHLAAMLCGDKPVTVENLLSLIEPAFNQKNILLEGAGGICTPINERETFADLFALCNLPLIIVSSGELGEISNLLTTIHFARCAGLRIAGFIFSDHNNLLANDCHCNTEPSANHGNLCGQPGGTRVPAVGMYVNLDDNKAPFVALDVFGEEVISASLTPHSHKASTHLGLTHRSVSDGGCAKPSLGRPSVLCGPMPYGHTLVDKYTATPPVMQPASSLLSLTNRMPGGLCNACFARVILYDNARTVSSSGVPFLGVVPFLGKSALSANNNPNIGKIANLGDWLVNSSNLLGLLFPRAIVD